MFSLRTFSMQARRALGILALGLFVLTLSATAALAQAINAEGAAQLKADIERALERRAANFSAQGDGTALQRDGELTVTPQGSYYAVVLPHLSMKGPQGGTMDIGVIKLNAIPAGQDQWRVTMAIPTPLTGFDATGVPRVKFSVGKQQFTGIWHAKYDTYTETNLDYSNITLKITEPGNEAQFDLGNVRGTMKLSEQSPGMYSGPYDFVVEDTRFSAISPDTGKPITGSIARIETSGRMVNADLKKAHDFETEMSSRVEGMQSDPNNVDPQIGKAIVNDAMEYLTSFADNFDTTFNLQGLDINVDNPDNPSSPMRIQMDRIGFGFTVDGMNNDTMTLNMNYGVEDLNVIPAPPESTGYLPFTMLFNVSTENVPHKVLTGILSDNVSANIDAQQGQGAPANPAQTMMETKNALANAGTVVRLDGTRLSAGALDARMSGEIRASATSVLGAVMSVKLVLKGVDKVMASLSQPGVPPQAMQQGMGMLGMLQSMGKPEVGDDGSNVLVYNLEVTEDGRALLNGNPMPVPGMGGGPGMGGPGMQGGQPMPLP